MHFFVDKFSEEKNFFFIYLFFFALVFYPFSHSRSFEKPLTLALLFPAISLSDLGIEMATPMVEDTSSFEEDQLASMSTEDITRATRLLDNEIRILKVRPQYLSRSPLSYIVIHDCILGLKLGSSIALIPVRSGSNLVSIFRDYGFRV